MPASFLRCDQCQTILNGASVNTAEPRPCPGCGAPLLAWIFPAFFRADPAGHAAEAVLSDEDASCFFHPRKKAVVPCAECGRFLCSLCDLEVGGRHLCPNCLDSAPKQPRPGVELKTQAFLYDRLAVILGVWPILLLWMLWPALLFTGAAAVYLSARYWNEPARAMIPRPRWPLLVAALLGILQFAVASFLLYLKLSGNGRGIPF